MKLQIVSIILTQSNNPAKWTETDLKRISGNKLVVGYIFKPIKTAESQSLLNLYVIKAEALDESHTVIDITWLQNAFMQWLESLSEDPKSFVFRNPPLDKWLETKDNWIKKVTSKLAETYNKTYDECLSALYMSVLHCYHKGNIYIGNLYYLVTSAHNRIRIEHRFMKNRLCGEHPDAVHLDAVPSDFNASLDDSISSFHEIVGGVEDPYVEQDKHLEMVKAIKNDMLKEFSEREIDQIINSPGYLPNTLYRKLLKWRKDHKREDYL